MSDRRPSEPRRGRAWLLPVVVAVSVVVLVAVVVIVVTTGQDFF
ncbi:hypothetical protein SOM11_11205 [Frigoribacterium sp. CFBP9039]|nr:MULTISPECIES: hypothetical protein [unclassified Frigoribacterium]MDY0890768.1 hypothetical protein [Frigoribacterium sp. CFBP9030]MDY0946551.1 hypothetical protein [Frigoribacterium sp. CFBP9039]